jgi:hypothetical protein
MESFIHSLEATRKQNAYGKYFVPENVLSNLMTVDALRAIFLETGLEHYQIEEMCSQVLAGAHKTFAILVCIKRPELISAFIQSDQMQPRYLDQRLPIDLQKLLTLIGDASTAAQFYSRQWEFIAPVFSLSSLSRNLEKETVLPFLESEDLGEGGFGEVRKILIHSSHHSLSDTGQHIVSLNTNYATHFRLECRIANITLICP